MEKLKVNIEGRETTIEFDQAELPFAPVLVDGMVEWDAYDLIRDLVDEVNFWKEEYAQYRRDVDLLIENFLEKLQDINGNTANPESVG